MNESFSILPMKWRVLISLGIVFTIITVILIIILIIMSETDLLGYKFTYETANGKDLEEFDDLFKDFGNEVEKTEVEKTEVEKTEVEKTENEEYPVLPKIKDLDNNYILDLLKIILI